MSETQTVLLPFSAIGYLESLVQLCKQQTISDLHIEPMAQQWRIRYRQDGLLHLYGELPQSAGLSLINRIKLLSHCDIAEKRLPQDGGFSQGDRDFRVSTCLTVYGEKVVLRCFDATQTQWALTDLGFSNTQLQLVEKHLTKPHGLIVVTGPTGSGKSLTLYSALQWLQSIHVNIVTLEDPVEMYLSGINQINIHAKAGLHFANALRALLRQDPDIMMIGEMRDIETIEIALHAAQTGHLVLTTLHTNNSYEAVIRLLQMGIAPYQISSSIRLVIAQRLIRTLCPYCLKQRSCTACHQGYLGRTAIFECLEMTDALASLIHNQPNRTILKQYQQDQGLVSLWQHGMSKVKAGISDEAELRRIADS